MPAALSAEAKALIDRPNFAHLATLMADGSPQSVPVWVGREGDRLLVGRVALVIEVDKVRYTKLPFAHTPPRQ
jgi:nitroimidazol reductase NimA-like FMN-containing flavoprotein (pyridoxamine 5'-phosphate oxidase superfamily)